MKFQYSFMILLVIFAGCHKKELKVEIKSLKIKKSEYEHLLAQHDEIPDPQIGFEIESITQDSQDKRSIEIVYKPIKKSTSTIENIKKSYIADMEMLGWQCIGEFDGLTSELIFQKAGRKLLSTITIQPNLQIKVIVYTKK